MLKDMTIIQITQQSKGESNEQREKAIEDVGARRFS
jgi:hypothetical protein